MKKEVNTEPEIMILYLDVYFLVNLLMDLLILDLTRHILKLSCRSRRLLLASVASAAVSCITIMTGVHATWWRVINGVGGAFLLTAAAFGWADPPEMVRRSAVLLLSGMVISGGIGLTAGSGRRVWMIVLWGLMIALAVRILWETMRKRYYRRQLYCMVCLEYRGCRTQVRALADTGNRLYEPYGHQPVHVVAAEPMKRICRTVSQVIYIPYCSVGKRRGILPAVRIDRMTVEQEGKPEMQYERPWLAVSPYPLDPGRRYEMLLHMEE